MSKKIWVAAVFMLLAWASIQSEQVFAKGYLTDEIGEGSIFHLDAHLHHLPKGSEVYIQEGHIKPMTEVIPIKPFCILHTRTEKADQDFVVHFANAASPHWFFGDSSDLECRRVDTEEDFHAAVLDLVSVEKHQGRNLRPSEVSKI